MTVNVLIYKHFTITPNTECLEDEGVGQTKSSSIYALIK